MVWSWFFPPAGKGPEVPCIRAALIGRQHSGKTTLLDGLDWHCLGERLPSGLCFGVPRAEQLPRRLARGDDALAGLRVRGRGTTAEAETYSFALLDRGKEVARLEFTDAVGQDLTRPTAENREARRRYKEALRRADVLVPVFPCPPGPASYADERRLRKTYLFNEAYLRAALEGRQSPRPASLLAVVTRLDARYRDEADARKRMPREFFNWLRGQLGLLARREDVGSAWAVPVSFFGFGSAVARPRTREDGAVTFGEGEWLLGPGRPPRPFNLMTFLVTAALCGLRNREADAFADVDGAIDLCRRLASDLDALGGWREPLGAARRGPITPAGEKVTVW